MSNDDNKQPWAQLFGQESYTSTELYIRGILLMFKSFDSLSKINKEAILYLWNAN